MQLWNVTYHKEKGLTDKFNIVHSLDLLFVQFVLVCIGGHASVVGCDRERKRKGKGREGLKWTKKMGNWGGGRGKGLPFSPCVRDMECISPKQKPGEHVTDHVQRIYVK